MLRLALVIGIGIMSAWTAGTAEDYKQQLTDAFNPGIDGCDPLITPLVAGSELCISWSAPNRSGTSHGALIPACSTSGARGPDLDPQTELSIFMAHGSVRDLAFHLGCAFRLDVSAAPDVADLTVSSVWLRGIIGSPDFPPITTSNETAVDLNVDWEKSRIVLTRRISDRK